MKKKILWITGAALVLVAAVIAAVFAFGSSGPKLYRNLDGHLYSINTQMRQKAEDGLYHLRFACEGEVVEYTVAEEETVLRIDRMDVLGLKTDKNGAITEVLEIDSFASQVFDDYFVRKVEGSSIHANSSLVMNGADATAELTKKTKLYDICDGSVKPVTLAELKPLDAVSVYADEKGRVIEVYVISHPVESELYWRTARFYSSSTKETTREPDENGVYSMDFYCNGEVVTLKCRDKALVTKIDYVAADNAHFGFVFDEEGYIVETARSAFGLRGVQACEEHDVISITGGVVHTVNLLSGKGEVWDGTVAENCKIYDISDAAIAEDRLGQAVEQLQVGDRITVITDTENRAICVYILERIVDVPVYFSTSRKYSSTKKETTREPDQDGFYSVSLLKAGDTEAKLYKTQDKDLMTYLDSTASRCVGIVADENNVLQRVYMPQCLFGQTAWSNGGVVAFAAGAVVTRMTYGNPNSLANGVMMPDCKVYNVSTTGEYGAETTLQQGDYIYAFRQPSGELVTVFVVRRALGAETMYYNLKPQYDKEKKQTTRPCDQDGVYRFSLAYEGKTVELEVADQALADKLDSYTAVSLKVEGNRIVEVNAPNYACGGSEVAKNLKYNGLNSKGKPVAVDEAGKETAFTMGSECVIYNVTGGSVRVQESLQTGDVLTVYTDRNGTARIIFVQG